MNFCEVFMRKMIGCAGKRPNARPLCFVLAAASAGCGGVSNPATPDASVDATVDAAPDAPRCVPSPAGLQARWRGEMNATDDTGAHDGVAIAGQYTPSGRHGAAFLFDGMQSVVTADPQDTLWPPGSFSVEAWVRPAPLTMQYASVLEKYGCGGADGCDGSDYEFLINNGHPEFAFRVNGGQVQIEVATLANILDDGWHHLVGVRDVERMQQRFYVDGALAVSRPIGGIDLDALVNADGKPDPITIGAGRSSGVDTMTEFFPGAIDDVAIYYSALDDDQVAALHAAPDGVCR
jgi:hypothetical protein